MAEALEAAREAIQRHDWAAAREGFIEADKQDALGPPDLQQLGDASWWVGFPDDAIEAYERAYAGFASNRHNGAAAYVAAQLAYLAFRRASFAVGRGWIAKAEQILEDEPEAREHAWIKLLHAAGAAMSEGDVKAAVLALDDAIAIARQRDVPEVLAIATSVKGYTMIGAGDWREGIALIDQAAAAAVSGELELRIACDVYCNTIAACRNMADYGRAGEWTEEADRWMQRNSLGGYPGICRVHRAELSKLHGSYAEAEQQARVACDELERYRLLDAVASAYKEMGDVRLRRGDLDAADESLALAYQYGSDGQPARALVLLARGDVKGAAGSIDSALGAARIDDESAKIRLSRSRLLPAKVTIALANDDPASARVAAEELEQLSEEFEQPAFEAAALAALGAMALHENREVEAIEHLDQAWRRWRDVGFPYESAQARLLLGQAQAAAGDEPTARMDFEAARSVFERLGAALDARRAAGFLGESAVPAGSDGRRVTKTFMFTDIVTSTELVGLLGDDAWESLLHWHDQALRAEFSKYRGQEVRHTGDGFFVAFDAASDGVDAAVAIQRRLETHRRESGFAPWVRIGLHTAEATPQGGDYAGHGVHVAARVGDIGKREEIVASAEAIEHAGTIRFGLSDVRTVELKGVGDPVDVRRIEWR